MPRLHRWDLDHVKSMWKGLEVLKKRCFWSIGDGSRVDIWSDL